MPESDDHQLLREFAQTGSETAFAVLVERYVNLVYSAAVRSTGNQHDAEEITQAVFIILARKADKLSPRTILSGWLYQTTRLTAANFNKGEGRRQRREQEVYMQSTLEQSQPVHWEQLAPLLEEAMGRLDETDRTAIVLHYFEKKTAAQTAIALRTTEAAVYKRTHRALEKLKSYSVALRQARDPHLAEEITQAVFIILARKAGSLGDKTILSGWLCRAARYAAANALKIQTRRQHREQEAFMQQTLNEPAPDETWDQISPLLDDAMQKLGQKDHDALVLRYFENRNFAEVGAALGASEDAAKMRVSRALEKLRKLFTRKGVESTTGTIAENISHHSIQLAPETLAATISASVAKGSAVAASTLTLVKSTLKIMTYAKLKLSVGIAGAILLVAGTATVAISQIDGNNQPSNSPTPQEIFQKTQNAYASLSSYSDNGQTVATVNGMTLTTTFTVKLARPNLYKIDWQQVLVPDVTMSGAVWCAGKINYLKMTQGSNPQNEGSAQSNLGTAAGISSGATTYVPETFFNIKGNPFAGVILNAKRSADEQIDGEDCYVLTSELKGRTTTLWIGKTDFLFRQVRVVSSAAVVKQALDQAAKINPNAPHPAVTSGIVSTETYENIVVNQKFSPSDFQEAQ